MKLIIDIPENVIEGAKSSPNYYPTYHFEKIWRAIANGIPYEPKGEYVDISKLRLMTVEECAGHTIEYAMGWKACIEWIKKGGAEE